jgi:hypothetical protein
MNLARQKKLAEVGAAGQERLERAAAEIRGRDGAMTELAYLVRAGVGRVTVLPGAAPKPFAHAEWFRFDGARSAGAGAWRALSTIRDALGVRTP